MKFTLSVRSFQVPATPFTLAWPPSFPSVPTSRATRVTSEANEFSWSTMVLMVFFRSRISPRTSTVIFFDKSPMATAVVTSAMLRTWPVRFAAIRFTLSVRSFQVPPTPATLAWPPSLPSVPTSRATRVTSEANEFSWSTMVLMVTFSSRISPFTSTVIFLERSPLATAVVTSAMLRTWPVRFAAIRFTLSVRSFQVPATPFTLAWPPSFPSVPTSRATRVTSEANEFSWSTMVLMVDFSSSTSPFTSTVIFLERSPLATAVVTSAMLRTWPVRFAAIAFTLSVRSFQVPATPFTRAWPPSLPSVPTSRATRVTSDTKDPSWSTIVFTTLPLRRNSPLRGRPSISRFMVCPRSPRATAPTTRAISAVGAIRSAIRLLTVSTLALHEPTAFGSRARTPIFPCLPTWSPSLSSSLAIRWLSSTTSLKASAISPSRPESPAGSRTEKSPLRKALSADSNLWLSTGRGELDAVAALAIRHSLKAPLGNRLRPRLAKVQSAFPRAHIPPWPRLWLLSHFQFVRGLPPRAGHKALAPRTINAG